MAVLSELDNSLTSKFLLTEMVNSSPITAVVILFPPLNLNVSPRLTPVPVLSSPTKVIGEVSRVEAAVTQDLVPNVSLVSTYPVAAGTPKSGSVSDNCIKLYLSAVTAVDAIFFTLPLFILPVPILVLYYSFALSSILNVSLNLLFALAEIFNSQPVCITNLPDIADAASFAGISKSFNNSVAVDVESVTITVTVPAVPVTLAICANNTIPV